MNKSFDLNISQSHYLPKISKANGSSNFNEHKSSMNSARYRAQSTTQLNSNVPLTRKLVKMDEIRNINQYESMNEKQLLREHEKLLRIIKKFQEIIDIHLSRKKRQIRSNSINVTKSSSTKEELIKCQIENNKKIIQNYQRQIKELQSTKKQRKLNDVIQQKLQVQAQINLLKKDIFNLKNDDNMAARSLIENRPQIEKELKQIEKDLKIQLTKKHQYIKKMDELNQQLKNLKKECEAINSNQNNSKKNCSSNILMNISTKKAQLKEAQKYRQQIEQSIQENMISKAKRNKGIRKQIQNCQQRMAEMNNRIQQYRQKISRYQIAMEILPKTASEKPQQTPTQNQ